MNHLKLTQLNLPKINVQQTERYLPSAFDGSHTTLQKLNTVIGYLHQYGEVTEEMITKWNEVYHWVSNEGLDDSVGNRLTEWVENGTLSGIINDRLLNDINNSVKGIRTLSEDTMKKVNTAVDFMYQEYYNVGNTTFEWSE